MFTVSVHYLVHLELCTVECVVQCVVYTTVHSEVCCTVYTTLQCAVHCPVGDRSHLGTNAVRRSPAHPHTCYTTQHSEMCTAHSAQCTHTIQCTAHSAQCTRTTQCAADIVDSEALPMSQHQPCLLGAWGGNYASLEGWSGLDCALVNVLLEGAVKAIYNRV